MKYAAIVLVLVGAVPAWADGTTQSYDPGQFGGPAGSIWLSCAQGFGSCLAPMVTVLLPVMVVYMAILVSPTILAKFMKRFSSPVLSDRDREEDGWRKLGWRRSEDGEWELSGRNHNREGLPKDLFGD